MMDLEKLLHYAIENGIFDMSDVRHEVEMYERKKLLQAHKGKIWQGKNKRWYTYLYDDEGGRKLLSKSTKRELEECILDHERKEIENPKIEKLFLQWVDKKLEYGDIVESTHTRYITAFNSYFGEFRCRRIQSIRQIDIEDFLKKTVRDFSLSRKSYGRITLIINGVFNMARKQGLIEYRIKDILDDVEFSKNAFSKTVKKDEERIFSKREEEIITEYLRNHVDIVNLGILLLFKTGLRIGELTALTKKDIHADRISVTKTETKYRNENGFVCEVRDHPKTEAGIREVLIDKECVRILHQIKMQNPFGEYLFMRNGKRCNTEVFRRRLHLICTKTDIKPKGLHKIRAAYGTKLYDGGATKSFICQQMGHTDISCVEKNYYFNRQSDEEKLSVLEQIL